MMSMLQFLPWLLCAAASAAPVARLAPTLGGTGAVPRVSLTAPALTASLAAPSLGPALAPPSLALPAPSPAPLVAAAPAPWLQPLGTPGPGVTPAHADAVQRLADDTGLTLFIHGSRQTGVRIRDGSAFTAESDLDLGVVGSPEAVRDAASIKWDGVPDAKHGPMWSEPTVEEAVGRGHLVFSPRRPLAHHDDVHVLASPFATAVQLARIRAQPRAPGEAVRFAVIGDAEPGRFWFSRALFGAHGVFWRLLARADSARPDFILQLGDLVSQGKVSLFRQLFQGLRAMALRSPFLTIIGNHDRHKPHGVTNDRLFRRYWGAPDWVLDRGEWRFVSVDSSAGRITPAQLEWLDRVLDPSKKLIVFTHIPPAALHLTDAGPLKGAGGFKRGAPEFMALMSERKVQRVYMGHVHGLGVQVHGGVTYVLSGGGGSPLYPSTSLARLHHYLEVEAGPEGVRETVRPLNGTPFPLLPSR
jgi:hypothetical protein